MERRLMKDWTPFVSPRLRHADVYRSPKMFGAIPPFTDGVGDLTYAPCDVPEERTLIHFGKMESGYARNIVSDYSHLLGTVRAYDEDHFQRIIGILTKNLEKIEAEYHCTASFPRSD